MSMDTTGEGEDRGEQTKVGTIIGFFFSKLLETGRKMDFSYVGLLGCAAQRTGFVSLIASQQIVTCKYCPRGHGIAQDF